MNFLCPPNAAIFRVFSPPAISPNPRPAFFARRRNEARCITVILLIISATFLAGNKVQAANNPLNVIKADSFGGESGNIKTEVCSEGGLDICSIHNGDYAVYKGFDFDSGVAGFQARIATQKAGTIEIRLDSPAGALMGVCAFASTGGWQDWRDITCKVDHSQAGVRDVYLIFHGNSESALINVRSFVFLKSIVISSGQIAPDLQDRIDVAGGEVQSTHSWGMPENGFTDGFEDGRLANWNSSGIVVTKNAIDKHYSAESSGTHFNFALTPNAYINQTDTGGEWRTLAEASLAADIVLDSPTARPGIGFSSKDGNRCIYVTLNAEDHAIEAWRKLADGSTARIKKYSGGTNAVWRLRPGVKYRLKIDWSPYSDGLMVFLKNDHDEVIANFRTVIDLPAARRPLMVDSGGSARFDNIKFDPTLDDWELHWQWKKTPVLTPDVCNPAVWKGKDGRYYMMWRKFGADTYHGIAASADGVHWTQITNKVLKCTGDMNVVVNPFGDGLVYVTPGGNKMPWFASDGSNHFTIWKNTGLNVGDIFGNSRIQEIIDTQKYPQLKPVHFGHADYRFIAFTENWVGRPKPHTVVLLSNTLTNWVLANPQPLIPPRADFWGEKGSAIGSAIVLPNGNILVASCSCTFAGYTGAPEPSNVSAIVDGKQPWKVLKLGALPDAPVSRENVWYQGPNFGTALYYEPKNDTLYFYGGFHDYSIGMMRVRHFSQSRLFAK